MKIPAHAKYQIIYDTMQKNDNLLIGLEGLIWIR